MGRGRGPRIGFLLAGLLVAAAGATALLLIERAYRSELAHQRQHRLDTVLAEAHRQMQSHMAMRRSAVKDLRAFMLAAGRLPPPETFDRFAASLREHYPSIEALVQVGPDLVIRHIHPEAGHEQAIGVDLSERPSAPAIRRAVADRRVVMDPPHTTIGGDEAFLIRAPLYLADRFVGLAQGLFNVRAVVEEDLGYLLDRYRVQLRDGTGRRFWGEAELGPEQVATPVSLENAVWSLALAPRKPLLPPSELVLATIRGGGLAMVLILLYGLYLVWRHKERLDTTISQRTFDLRERNLALERQVGLRRKTEQSLRRSEARLKEAQAIAHVGSWEWDVAADALAWSDELFRIFGSEPGAFRPTYQEYVRRVHPDDRPAVERVIADAAREGDSYENEYRILWPDGTVRFLRGRGRVFRDERGRPVRMAGIAQDVTAQREAEAAFRRSESKYQAVLENASDGIAVADPEGRFLEANRVLLENLGYSEEEFRRLKVTDVHPPEEADRLQEVFRAIREDGHSITEHQVVRKDGSTYPAEVAGTLIELEEGPVALGIFRDITERKRLEAELRGHRDELERRVAERTRELTAANEELEAFSYSVSHDLRGPLRTIDGFGEVLMEEFGDALEPEARGYIGRMQAASARMAQLIDGLLTLSRTSRTQLERQPVDLSAVARTVIEELQAAEPERAVAVTLAPEAQAVGDPALLRALLENLLGNAWKFTRGREGAAIELGVTETGGEPVYFVADNGAGFDMAHADHLFQPFQRLHRVEEFDGSGIGLATVHRIVRRHGGRIWAEATPGEGATFFFTLATGEAGSPAGSARPVSY